MMSPGFTVVIASPISSTIPIGRPLFWCPLQYLDCGSSIDQEPQTQVRTSAENDIIWCLMCGRSTSADPLAQLLYRLFFL